MEEALKEARRQELIRKHQALKAKEAPTPAAVNGTPTTGQAMGDARKAVAAVEYDPFAEDEYPRPVVHAITKVGRTSNP